MPRLLVALLATLITGQVHAQVLARSVDVDGVLRNYLVYLPAAYSGEVERPVMLTYHGGGMTALQWLRIADMRALADAYGYILVYPQGLPDDGEPIWNSEGPFSNGVDEIGFTRNMIDALALEFAVDQSRVYASGYSNGANLVWELACLLSDRIAAVGAVAGSMWTWTVPLCTPSRPVPLVSIHGTLDFYNPYQGGPPFSLGLIDVSQAWVRRNGADPVPDIVDVPDTAPNDGSTVDHFIWSGGEACTHVEHYRVQLGGHDWPGAFGNMDIDASTVIWDFASRYALDGALECAAAADETG